MPPLPACASKSVADADQSDQQLQEAILLFTAVSLMTRLAHLNAQLLTLAKLANLKNILA
eukprot:1158686-Pelagomonas_calceolata.AAC.3